MADTELALLAVLSANAEITALVGNRIYSPHAPEPVEYPYIKYFNISGNRGMLLKGDFEAIERERWQFDIYAEEQSTAKELRVLLLEVLKIVQQEITISTDPPVFVTIQGSIPASYNYPTRDPITQKYGCSVETFVIAEA